MRARPEDISDASFLGKLLVLPANVRLDWKVIARYKHSSLFGLFVSNEEKSFIALTPVQNFDFGLFELKLKLKFKIDKIQFQCYLTIRHPYFSYYKIIVGLSEDVFVNTTPYQTNWIVGPNMNVV